MNDLEIKELLEKSSLAIIEISKRLELAKKENIELKSMVEYQEGINKTMIRAFNSDDWADMKKIAKILNYEKLGRNIIFRILRERDILMTGGGKNNEPMQKYVNLGYFKVLQVPGKDQYGNEKIYPKTVVSQKGLNFIREVLDNVTGK